MGDGRAQHIAIKLPLQGDIIRILTRAGDQAKILFTLDRLVDTEFYHGSSPFLWRTPHPSARSCLILSTQTGRFQGGRLFFCSAASSARRLEQDPVRDQAIDLAIAIPKLFQNVAARPAEEGRRQLWRAGCAAELYGNARAR